MGKPVYLYVTPYMPSPESWRGGYCLDAAKAIARDGRYDLRAVTFGRGGNYDIDGLHVIRARRLTAPCLLFQFLLDPINDRLLLRALRRNGIFPTDIAVCHANAIECGHNATFIRRLNPKAKAVLQIHFSYGLFLSCGRLGVVPLHAEMLYLRYRRMLAEIDMLAFVSEMARDTFGKRFIGSPEGEVADVRQKLPLGRLLPPLRLPKQCVIYNGIDTSLFSGGRTAHNGFVIGCVGNFFKYKGQMTLLEAALMLKGKVPGLRVRFVGTGPTLAQCRRFVADNHIEDIVSFEEERDHGAMPDFYRALDLCVMPSRVEGFNSAAIEAWACGTPCVASETSSFREVLPAEDCDDWLFRPCDPASLAERIVDFHRRRPAQRLARDLNIDAIWRTFLNGGFKRP